MLAGLRFSKAIISRTIKWNAVFYVKRSYLRCFNCTTSYRQLLEKDVTSYTNNTPANKICSVIGSRNKYLNPLSQAISSGNYEDNTVGNSDTFRFKTSPDCNKNT